MDEAHVAALSHCMPMLCEDLELLEVIPRLVSAGVLRLAVAEQINAEKTKYERNCQLVFTLRKMNKNDFEEFLNALRETGQTRIVQQLQEIPLQNIESHITSSSTVALKNYYSSAFSKTQPFSGLLFTFDVKDTFVSLTMKGKNEITEDHCSLIDEAFTQIEFPNRKLLIIEGNAATGKTSLMRRIAYDWATGQLTQFDIVLYAEFRQLTASNYASIVAMGLAGVSVYLEEYQTAVVEKDIQDLLNHNKGRKILVLLDGYDEGKDDHCKQLECVLRDDICPNLLSYVILSSRPEHIAQCRNSQDRIALANILGFKSYDQKKSYIRKHFFNDENAEENIRIVENKLHANEYLMELAATPLFLVFLCIVSKNCKSNSIKELYQQICIWLLKRYIKEKSDKEIPELLSCDLEIKEYRIENCLLEFSSFRKLGRLAFEMLFDESKDRLVFSLDDLQKYEIPKYVQKIGLLATDDRFNEIGRSKIFMFPHKSFQEFFAAFYFWNWCPVADVCFVRIASMQRNQNEFGKFLNEIADKQVIKKYREIFYPKFCDYAVQCNAIRMEFMNSGRLLENKFFTISSKLCALFEWDMIWLLKFPYYLSSICIGQLKSIDGKRVPANTTAGKTETTLVAAEVEFESLCGVLLKIFDWANNGKSSSLPKFAYKTKCTIILHTGDSLSEPVKIVFKKYEDYIRDRLSEATVPVKLWRCIVNKYTYNTDYLLYFCRIFRNFRLFLRKGKSDDIIPTIILEDECEFDPFLVAASAEYLRMRGITRWTQFYGQLIFEMSQDYCAVQRLSIQSLNISDVEKLMPLRNCKTLKMIAILAINNEKLSSTASSTALKDTMLVLAEETPNLTLIHIEDSCNYLSEDDIKEIQQVGRVRWGKTFVCHRALGRDE